MKFLLLRYTCNDTGKADVFLHVAQTVLTNVVCLNGWIHL
jgi:hypothetical protein